MATSYSKWGGNNGLRFRLKLTVSLVTQNVAANKTSVRIRAWIISDIGRFSITSPREMRFNGTELMSRSTSVSLSAGGSTLLGDYQRTLEHNSRGEATVKASASFSNSLTGSHSTSLSVDLPRIPQYPNAPSSAPTMRYASSKVTSTSATANGNGGSILEYGNERRRYWNGAWSSWTKDHGKTVTFPVARIATSYQYQGRTRARTSRGWGPYSSVRTITIPALPPDNEVDGVEMTLSLGTVRASWDAPPASVSGYEVALHDGTSWGSPISTGTTRFYEFTGLSPGTYRVRARSILSSGPTAWSTSEEEFLGGLPGPVDSVTFTEDGAVVWEPPAADGGLDIEGYDVEWYDGFSWGMADMVDDVQVAFAGTRPGVGYRCRVRPINSLGAGPWATSVSRCTDLCTCAA